MAKELMKVKQRMFEYSDKLNKSLAKVLAERTTKPPRIPTMLAKEHKNVDLLE